MHQVVAYKRLKTVENNNTKSGFKIEKSKAKQVSCQKQASHLPKPCTILAWLKKT